MNLNPDLDFLAARVHGRRARMAEGRRLDELCRLESVSELSRVVLQTKQFESARELQRQLLEKLITELTAIARELDAPGADLMNYLLTRFQLENVKVLLRGFLARTPKEKLAVHLLRLPLELAVDAQELLAADSLENFGNKVSVPFIAEALRKTLRVYGQSATPFLVENCLEAAYLGHLLTQSEALRFEDRRLTTPIIWQEIEAYHLLLIVRSKFHYDLEAELLWPLHVSGTRISRNRFRAMAEAPDVATLAQLATGHALDADPSEVKVSSAQEPLDATTLESAAWKRLLRLANRAFRRSHMGVAAIFGYATIRRIEAANLITVSEGIKAGVEWESLRSKLIPRVLGEAAHV